MNNIKRMEEIIAILLKENNVNISELGRRLGMSRQQVWNFLNPEKHNGGGMSIVSADRILDQLGYRLAVVSKSYNLGGNCYMVDGSKRVKESENPGNGRKEEGGSVS